MGKKQGNCKFRELRRALGFGHQIFEGYPHRRHRKRYRREGGIRAEIIRRVRSEEEDKIIRRINYNLNDENL